MSDVRPSGSFVWRESRAESDNSPGMERRTDGFFPGAAIRIPGAAAGPLAGLTFAVKDVVDIAGEPTSAGNPDWRRTHPTPARTAPCVQTLLDAGATLVGKTMTDEMCSSMSGINVHYGTPVNPAAPGCLSGGSSSGSASVVAGGLCDFSIGTDTSGSVRLPAAYCGVFGYRPTHGRIATEGVFPLAPSFDAVGVLARDPVVLARVARVFDAGCGAGLDASSTLLVAMDAFSIVERSTHGPLMDVLMRLRGFFANMRGVEVHGGAPFANLDAHSTLVGLEYYAAHQAWIDATNPTFGPDVASRNAVGAPPPDANRVAAAKKTRADMRNRMTGLLTPGTVLAIPSSFSAAPPVDTPLSTLVDSEVLSIVQGCVASLAGLPQVSAPWAWTDEGLPVGFSFVAAQNEDERLLALVTKLHRSMPVSPS